MWEKKDVVVHIRIDAGMKAELEALARSDERKLSPYIARLLRKHIAEEKAAGRMPEVRLKRRKP